MDAFDLLCLPVRKAAREKFGGPTEVQEKSIPHVLKGENCIIIAPTGTGKTEAALLPVFDLILRNGRNRISALYITPLKALNRDLLERMEWWCRKLDLKLAVRHGDTSMEERKFQSIAPPHILITTPEMLQALLTGKILRKHLKKLKHVIIDELHEIATDKRGSQLSIALERLQCLANFQKIGLSATVGSPKKLANFLKNCKIIDLKMERKMKLEVIYEKPKLIDYKISKKLLTFPEVACRLRLIKKAIEKHQSTLVFTNTRAITEILTSRFRVLDTDFPIGIHHSSLSKLYRLDVEKKLKNREIKGIICTSSLELGIDIGSLDLVIHYGSPHQVTRLVQRVGRSGHRIGKIAKGIIIAQDDEDALESLVISKRAYEMKLEEIKIPNKPYDVLIHQIAGIIIEGERDMNEIYNLIKNSYPYRNLKREEFEMAIDYMRKNNFLKNSYKTRGTFSFYFENLSMIPDEKQYLVIDEEKNEPIGVLDEAFVAYYGEPNMKFIEGGKVWKILYVHKNKIYVKKDDDIIGAIPSWIGEEIPVPYEIAKEVGNIRRRVEEMLKKRRKEEVVEELTKLYPCKKKTMENILEKLFEQYEKNYPIPTDKRIVIEKIKNKFIIHSSFGLLVNRTISMILGNILSNKVGYPIPISYDAYKIIVSSDVNIKECFLEIMKLNLEKSLLKSLENSKIFTYRFLRIARKMGAISKDADITKTDMQKIISAFKGTIVYKEAIRECLEKDFDLENAKKVVEEIRNGKIEIKIVEEETPIGKASIKSYQNYDIVHPERLEKLILKYAEARFMNEIITAVCLKCYYSIRCETKNFPFVCPNCKSGKIGILKVKEDVKKEIKKYKDKLEKTANLILRYKENALLALAANINLKTASSILNKCKEKEEIIKEIIKAEKRELMKFF